MANVIPAMKVKFGQTEYFVSYMHINDIVNHVKFPQDLEGWDDMSIEVKFQREINMKRVEKGIAPYFATDNARFSGALVLAIQNHESIEFESLTDFPMKIQKLYKTAAEGMGFLVFSGKEQLIPLDGQHRIKAFELATTGMDGNKQVPGLTPNTKLGEDQVAVILVRYEPQDARRIFNKINRYAKPTSKADNLITDDDDSMAVITRRLLGEHGVIPSRLVRLRGNTLAGKAIEFTTLSTFYDSSNLLFEILCAVGEGTPSDMTPEQTDTYVDELHEEWDGLLSNVEHWTVAIKDPTANGDEDRKKIRNETLLGKPIGQRALVGGYALRLQDDDKIDRESVFKRINAIDWSVKNKMWHDVLMHSTGRVMAGKTTVTNASKFIAYLLGAKTNKKELADSIYNDPNRRLPKPVMSTK